MARGDQYIQKAVKIAEDDSDLASTYALIAIAYGVSEIVKSLRSKRG